MWKKILCIGIISMSFFGNFLGYESQVYAQVKRSTSLDTYTAKKVTWETNHYNYIMNNFGEYHTTYSRQSQSEAKTLWMRYLKILSLISSQLQTEGQGVSGLVGEILDAYKYKSIQNNTKNSLELLSAMNYIQHLYAGTAINKNVFNHYTNNKKPRHRFLNIMANYLDANSSDLSTKCRNTVKWFCKEEPFNDLRKDMSNTLWLMCEKFPDTVQYMPEKKVFCDTKKTLDEMITPTNSTIPNIDCTKAENKEKTECKTPNPSAPTPANAEVPAPTGDPTNLNSNGGGNDKSGARDILLPTDEEIRLTEEYLKANPTQYLKQGVINAGTLPTLRSFSENGQISNEKGVLAAQGLIVTIIQTLLKFIASFALLGVVYNGIMLIATSSDDDHDDYLEGLGWCLAGLIVALLSHLLVSVVIQIVQSFA